jgi:hypothetical protein
MPVTSQDSSRVRRWIWPGWQVGATSRRDCYQPGGTHRGWGVHGPSAASSTVPTSSRLASNLSAGYPPSVSEPVAQRRLAGSGFQSGLAKMLVLQSLPSEKRKVAGSTPARPWPFAFMRVNGSFCDLEGSRSPMEIDNSPPRRDVTVRSRCARSPVRSRLTSAWKLPGQPFLLVRSSARHRRRTQLRSLSPYRRSRNPSTVERWACGEWRSWYRVEAFGSGSTCRWRRSAVVRTPAFGAGDRPEAG